MSRRSIPVFMAFEEKFLKANAKAVRDYVEDYLRAVNWALDHRAEAVRIYAEQWKLPVPVVDGYLCLFSLSKVMLIFTDCLFPVVIFTYHGARGLSPIYLWSAQSRGTGRVRMLWRVVLPLSLASISDGVQVAVVVAVLVAVVSEMVSGGGGLGHLMISAYRYGDVRTAFATLATISLIGYALSHAAQLVRTRLLFWHVMDA